jgi:hypothetical protein
MRGIIGARASEMKTIGNFRAEFAFCKIGKFKGMWRCPVNEDVG